MTPQNDDDEGTVIRPVTAAPAVRAPVAPPAPVGAEPVPEGSDGFYLRIGTRLAEFEVTERIGEGGFSIVYLAKDHSLERTVALKEYMPSSLATRIGSTQVQPRSLRYRDTFEAGLKSFVNEAKLLAQFDHPALVKVYRFWEANGTAYMVMPFYRGITVKDAVRAMPEPPDEAWLLGLLAPLTEALMVIHAEHCYHRDIAPDNVILLAGSAKPLLLDFGAARRVIGDMTQGLTVILKAGYAPVEQYAEIPGMKQGAWTDVYALAAVVYWAITGATPPASVGRMMSDSFVPLATCAAGRYRLEFLQAIDRALVVRPEQRTQSIEALRRDLGLTGEEAAAPPPARWTDSDATVIRPAGYKPGPATHARTVSTELPPASKRTTQPTLPLADPLADAEAQATPKQSVQPPSQEASPRPPAAAEPETKTGRRSIVLALAAAGTVAAAAGLWWATQKQGVQTSPTPQGSTSANAPAQSTTTGDAVGVTPASAPLTPTDRATPIEPLPTSVEAAKPTLETAKPTFETAKPPPEVAPSPADPTPEAPPQRTSKRSAPLAKDPAQTEAETQRASKRQEAARQERVQPDASHAAECARIVQRLSLGESSPELLERLKSLKCR